MTREFGVRRCWPGRKADSSCLAALARRNDKEKQIPPGSLRSRVGMTRELGGRRCWPGRTADSSWLAALARRNDKGVWAAERFARQKAGSSWFAALTRRNDSLTSSESQGEDASE